MDLTGYFTLQPPPVQDLLDPDIMDQYFLSYTTVSDEPLLTQETGYLPDLATPSYGSQRPSASIPISQDLLIAAQDSFQFHSDIVDRYLLPYPGGLFSTQGTAFLHGLATPHYNAQGSSALILSSSVDRIHESDVGDPPESDYDEGPEGGTDNQSYCPSPTPSLLLSGQYSPLSYKADESLTRGSSEPTLDEEAPGNPPPRGGKRYNGNNGTRRRLRGKATGSAALALVKVTVKNNKPLTSPFGTFVPYTPEGDGPGVISGSGEETTAVRPGRKRRNGRIPSPELVPDLIKRSRGRKLPSSRLQQWTDTGEPVFPCEVKKCGWKFSRREHLKRHLWSVHTNRKMHICPEKTCGKAFSRRDNLAQHSRIHLTDKDL